MPRAKQRTDELRSRLLEVAVERLERDGVAGFTTRRIAADAGTSAPAVYELFGDKAGLVQEICYEGFRRLRDHFAAQPDSDDPLRDLERTLTGFRTFVRANPVLAQVMFSRRLADLGHGPAEHAAADAVRTFVVARVQRAVDAGSLAGRATDIAHALLALAMGLTAQESAGWLGSSRSSKDRRWQLALRAVLRGFAPEP